MVALQPLSPENFPDLLKVLEKLLPDSLVTYTWILTQIKWAKKIPGLKITIMCPNGDWSHGVVVALGDGLGIPNKIYSVVYSPENHVSLLKEALMKSEMIDWGRMKHFSATSERLVTTLAEVLKEKGFKHTEGFHVPCYFHYIEAEEAANAQLPELPPNVRVGPLDVSHLGILCDNWRHYDPEYRPVVQKMIELNPSFGVFVKNESGQEELASMVVQAEYGGVGLLQTVPEHRRKGYASIALAYQTKALGKLGIMPHGHVLLWNTGSSELFGKHGFKVHGVSTWVLFTKLQEACTAE